MNEEKQISRRRVIGGLGTGLATAVAAPVLAASGGPHPEAPAPAALENPTSKHPKPPFKKQPQPWPGLASKMAPRPDHGETSYKGSGRLQGRKALITGAIRALDGQPPLLTPGKGRM